MKRVLIVAALVIVVGGIGALIYFSYRPLPVDGGLSDWASIADSLKAELPKDPKLAEKEYRKTLSSLEALQPKAPYIVIDSHSNKLSYRTVDSVFFKATCSTGSGGVLVDSSTKRQWVFNTPKGAFKVERKIENPWWRKPDWAFIEEGEAIPKDESDRMDAEVLGDFALGFGDGYFIHGTLYTRLLGISVTHGCVRLGDEDLKSLFKVVPVGTPIYIF